MECAPLRALQLLVQSVSCLLSELLLEPRLKLEAFSVTLRKAGSGERLVAEHARLFGSGPPPPPPTHCSVISPGKAEGAFLGKTLIRLLHKCWESP